MSLDFDGVDDEVVSDATQTWGNTFSAAAWINADDAGENNQGTVFTHGTTRRISVSWNASATDKKLLIFAGFSGSSGFWVMTTGFAAFAGWKWVMVTYDAGATTNDPILYTLDGSTFSTLTVGSGLTETGTPVGTIIADNLTAYLGMRGGSNTAFNGRIGEWASWKRIVPAAEAAAIAFLGVNTAPDHFNYLPLDPTPQNLGSSATAYTITGAVAGENPPVRPAGRMG